MNEAKALSIYVGGFCFVHLNSKAEGLRLYENGCLRRRRWNYDGDENGASAPFEVRSVKAGGRISAHEQLCKQRSGQRLFLWNVHRTSTNR